VATIRLNNKPARNNAGRIKEEDQSGRHNQRGKILLMKPVAIRRRPRAYSPGIQQMIRAIDNPNAKAKDDQYERADDRPERVAKEKGTNHRPC
jgi:malic enzyme